VFLFSSFGLDTLKELRDSWRQVDDEVHVNAFADMHDIGDSLIRNGLAAPVLSVTFFPLILYCRFVRIFFSLVRNWKKEFISSG